MDDMVFQNNNKNAIYVLNTSYNTYGEFGRPNGFGYPQISSDEIYSYPKSSLSRSLHKLKCFRHHSSEMISGSCSDTAERYSSSAAATYCSPAATALQKLFNCSNTAHGCKSINLKNKNCHSNSHIAHDLNHHGSRKDNQHHHRHTHPETGKQQYWEHPQLEYRHLEHHTPLSLRSNTNCGNNSTSSTSCVLPSVVSNSRAGTGKKKHSNSTASVKSTLIAKKTKFWKYLVEEEKWRKHSADNLSTTNCERDFGRSLSSSTFDEGNSQVTVDGCSGNERSVRTNRGSISNHSSKSNSSSCSGNDFRISNWSGSIDTIKSSNNNSHQKSSAELYKEAAQLLGLSCTLCDNCRCLDCQSRYFECDDSDSYSEFSFVDEFCETLQDVDRSLKHLHTRNFSSPSLQHSQEDEISLSDDQQTNTDLETNVLDHCESFNDLSLENSPESED